MEDVVLWHIADPSPEEIVVVVEVEPADDEPPGGGDGLAVEHREERALSGAAGPHDRHHLARLDNERDPLEEPSARRVDGDMIGFDDVAVAPGERLERPSVGGEAEALVGDLDDRPGGDLDGPLDPPAVDERAVGASQVADEDPSALNAHRGVERRGERPVEGDVGRGSAAEGHHRRVVEVDRPFSGGGGGGPCQEVFERRGGEAGIAERDRVGDVDPFPFHAPRRHTDERAVAAPQVLEPQALLIDDHPGVPGGDARSLDDDVVSRSAAEEDDPPGGGRGLGRRASVHESVSDGGRVGGRSA